MDEDIDDNPINKIPNPTAISAFCVNFCLLENVMINAPIPKINGAKKSGVPRLLIVGGAGTLFVKPGLRLMDTGSLPEAWLPGVKSLGEFYLNTLMNEKELDWVFLSPAANLGNLKTGVRTGKYRVGKDDLLVDEKDDSFISVEDYAVAMIDELETPKHHKERFTVAY